MREIQLTKNKVALVDDCDFECLNREKWHAYKGKHTWYSSRSGNWSIKMHRQIMGVTSPLIFVDHRDGNGLNNVRSNLRIADNIQNAHNQRISKRNTTGFKGVSWHKHRLKFIATIKADGQRLHLGYFISAIEAARAYNEAAMNYFGEFARLNVVN